MIIYSISFFINLNHTSFFIGSEEGHVNALSTKGHLTKVCIDWI